MKKLLKSLILCAFTLSLVLSAGVVTTYAAEEENDGYGIELLDDVPDDFFNTL